MSSSLKQSAQSLIKEKKINDSIQKMQGQIRSEYPTLPLIQKESDKSQLNERLIKLQGNLKLLQKKYRQNLKEGFDSKIKAYRLQAVFERKVLKNAMREIQRQNQISQIKKRWSNSQKKSSMFNSRIEAMKMERYQRSQHFQEKKRRERVSLSICLHENRGELMNMAKQSHDKVVEQQENINKKKDYFTFVRKSMQKREQDSEKEQLLQRIFQNTQKLKEAKETLSLMKYQQEREERDKTFVTI